MESSLRVANDHVKIASLIVLPFPTGAMSLQSFLPQGKSPEQLSMGCPEQFIYGFCLPDGQDQHHGGGNPIESNRFLSMFGNNLENHLEQFTTDIQLLTTRGAIVSLPDIKNSPCSWTLTFSYRFLLTFIPHEWLHIWESSDCS